MAARPVRQGDVYWIDCPPLHGDTAKRRPVVVVSSSQMLQREDPVLVVACTSSVLPSTPDAVELPNTGRTPQARSGMSRRTWAVPAWWLPVRRERLTEYAGFIRGEVLARVVTAAARHIARAVDEEEPGTS